MRHPKDTSQEDTQPKLSNRLRTLFGNRGHFVCVKRRLNYSPEEGIRSKKAERLVEFCLGKHADGGTQPFSGSTRYLQKQGFVHLKTGDGWASVEGPPDAAPGRKAAMLDQRRILDGLIDQKANIPPGLDLCLLQRDDALFEFDPMEGVHVGSDRRKGCRDIVLLPSSNRERFCGPLLGKQMSQLRASWSDWNQKADVVWWSGAVTGSEWGPTRDPTLRRQDAISHYIENPDERVVLRPIASNQFSGDHRFKTYSKFKKSEAFANKALLLLIGNDSPSGGSWYFCGNSPVLMCPPVVEHILYFEIEPWVHYVPIDPHPEDVAKKFQWVLDNPKEAQEIVRRSHERLNWLAGPEYLWAINQVLRSLAELTDK